MSIKDLLPYQPEQVQQRTPRPLPKPTVTRIDFHQVNIDADLCRITWGYRVEKYAHGWETVPGVRPIDVAENPPIQTPSGPIPFDLDKALHILEANGWTVRRWWNGARAWRDKIHPVRTRSEIHRARARLNRQVRSGLAQAGAHSFVDLAFDL